MEKLNFKNKIKSSFVEISGIFWIGAVVISYYYYNVSYYLYKINVFGNFIINSLR